MFTAAIKKTKAHPTIKDNLNASITKLKITLAPNCLSPICNPLIY